jgi:hypothetical protein
VILKLRRQHSKVAVETAIARRPRTDPGERNYRTGLLPWVMTSNRQSGQGCRSFGLGNQRSTIRISAATSAGAAGFVAAGVAASAR